MNMQSLMAQARKLQGDIERITKQIESTTFKYENDYVLIEGKGNNSIDLVKIKNGKDHKMLSNGKYPVLGSGGIMRYVDKFLYDKPSVLLPRKGTLDNIQYCDMPFWTVDTLYYTEVNTNLANPYYLYRYLSLLDLSNLDSGTGVPSMTFDNYYGLKIFLPNIEKQTKIAQILQTLDKKITINRQINQNLPTPDHSSEVVEARHVA